MGNYHLEQLQAWLRQVGLSGVVLTSQASLSWLFEGRFYISLASEDSIAQVLVTPNRTECIVNNIEALRLKREESLNVDVWHVFPWYDEQQKQKFLAEWKQQDQVKWESQVQSSLRDLRVTLSLEERDTARLLGRKSAEVVESVAKSFAQGETELAIAGQLSEASYRVGIEPITVLVTGEERAALVRHAVPTMNRVNQYAILSVCCRYKGIIASVTRMVSFGDVPDALRDKYRAVQQVDASILYALVPGARLSDVFGAAVAAYGAVGYPEEWRHHHQGGLAGYQAREIRATADSSFEVGASQLFAWNPTIAGVKAEDTVLVTDDGLEIVTQTESFPLNHVTVSDQSFKRPEILLR